MKAAPSWLRRAEMTLWIFGVTLIGVALGVTVLRWRYQAEQEAVLLREFESADTTPSPSAPPPAKAVETTPAATPGGAFPAPLPLAPERLPIARSSAPDKPLAQPERLPLKNPRLLLDPTAVGRLEIPRLGVAAIVKEGADEWTLARAVGLVPGSAHPGQTGNVVLAGHRDTFFRPLRKIRVNDRIRLRVPPNTYEYRVETTRIVSADETSVLQSKGIDQLTLVTCYPFFFIGPAPERFVVSAVRVN
jgi:sortase A